MKILGIAMGIIISLMLIAKLVVFAQSPTPSPTRTTTPSPTRAPTPTVIVPTQAPATGMAGY
jgi:hypothetical protein